MTTTPKQKTTHLQTNPKRTTKQPKMSTQTPTEIALAAAKAQLDENAAEIRILTTLVYKYYDLIFALKKERNEAILKVRDKDALSEEMLADNEALRQRAEAHCQRADFLEDQLRDREAKIRQLEAEGHTKSKGCCDDSESQKVREYDEALFLFNSYGLFNDHWGQPYDFTDEVEQPLLFCVRRTLAGYLQNEGVKMYKEALQNFKYKPQKGQEP